jgi:ribose 5-phosphate isomerase B
VPAVRIYLGTDHAGYDLKERVKAWLVEHGHEPVDCGAHVHDPDDDYVAFCADAARRVVADPGSLGVVLGGSGNGEAMAANKVAGARAALCWSPDLARLAREHNDANVLSLGARVVPEEVALATLETFLTTPFSGDDRHLRRIAQLSGLESSSTG